MAFTLESPVFKPNGPIPQKYTCEGEEISPPLLWKGAPTGTKSFAIVVDDPDAPDPLAPKMVWVHWIVYNIPADFNSIPEDFQNLPQGAFEALNDHKTVGYQPPCPPIGKHHYHHRIYALDTMLPSKIKNRAELDKAMKGHILAQTELIGTYKKVH